MCKKYIECFGCFGYNSGGVWLAVYLICMDIRVGMKKSGFTLIELLVVIAIIALLLAILAPTLGRVKEVGRCLVCLSNQGQLGKAWFMYHTDNKDNVVDGAPEWVVGTPDGNMTFNPVTETLIADGSPGGLTTAAFVSVPHTESGALSNQTMEDKIRGLELGGLWPYMESYKIYNCPSDKRSLSAPTQGSASNDLGGYRSYSIGAVYSLIGLYTASTTGEDKHVATKYTQIHNPSHKIVFIEEADGWGENGNTWNMWVNQQQVWDPFAVWHYGNSTFSFADGHAGKHKWTDKGLIEYGLSGNKIYSLNDEDYDWLISAYLPR